MHNNDPEGILKKYDLEIHRVYIIPDHILLAALFIFLICAFLLRENIWAFWICIYAVVRTWGDIAQRAGHRDGYLSGHQHGFEAGKINGMAFSKAAQHGIEV